MNKPGKPRHIAFKLELAFAVKHHADVFAGAHRYIEELGWQSTIDEYVAEKLSDTGVAKSPYDGVIARVTQPLAQSAIGCGLPIVNTWHNSPAREDVPGVFIDFAAVGRSIATHLMARGVQRFSALVTGDYSSKLAVAAFKETLEQNGKTCTITTVPTKAFRTYKSWQKLEQRLAASMERWQPPLGVYASQEDLGRLVIQMCRQRGWRVPFDVAIVAGMNEETICRQPRPSLTSIECGFERVGYEAAKMLHHLIDQRDKRKQNNNPPEHRFLQPTGLIARESSDFFAIEDPLIASAIAFIAEQSHRPINAEDVAEELGVGVRTIQMNFKQKVGRPISYEIQRVRIERAKRELALTSQPIHVIAKDVGFGRPLRMYNAFVREMGVTPSDYRKQRQRK